MPKKLHEFLAHLFRTRPTLGAELFREILRCNLPLYTDARTEAADFTDIQPTEYRADVVTVLTNDGPVVGLIVEVQLAIDKRKRFTWPIYAATLRGRLECDVYVLVVTNNDKVAAWAGEPIRMGGGSVFTPCPLHIAHIPELTSPEQARENPELAVLSAFAQSLRRDTPKSPENVRIAMGALRALQDERWDLYNDFILSHCDGTLRELRAMDLNNWEPMTEAYKQLLADRKARGLELGLLAGLEARKEIERAAGRREGRVDGHVELILRQLTVRFGPVSEEVQQRLQEAGQDNLMLIAERVLTAETVEQALGS